MSDEEQARGVEGVGFPAVVSLLCEPLVIQRRNDRIAGAGSSDDEVAMTMMSFPFNGELLDHLPLMRPRLDIEKEQRLLGDLAARTRQRDIQSVFVPLR